MYDVREHDIIVVIVNHVVLNVWHSSIGVADAMGVINGITEVSKSLFIRLRY